MFEQKWSMLRVQLRASCLQDLPDHIEAVAKVLPGLRQEIWGDDQTDPHVLFAQLDP